MIVYRIARCDVGENTLLDRVLYKNEKEGRWIVEHKGKEREINPHDLVTEEFYQTSSIFKNFRNKNIPHITKQ